MQSVMNSWAAFLLQLHSNRQHVRTLCDGKLVQNPKTWLFIFHDHFNHGITTLKPFCMKWEIAIIALQSSANVPSYLAIIKLHRSLSSGSLARCNPVTLLSSPTLSNLISRRHFSPLGLAKVGGWSWCNSALHLIIGAFIDNGEGRWNQFPASSTNMGQPSSPSTPSSPSYLSIRQVWNEDGRWRNTADWFDLHSCSTFLEAFRCW